MMAQSRMPGELKSRFRQLAGPALEMFPSTLKYLMNLQ